MTPPKNGPHPELSAIEALEAASPSGASVAEILGTLKPPLARRTLQRRLQLHVAEGRLDVSGRGAGVRYRTLKAADQVAASPPPSTAIALSTEGERLRQHLRKPLSERTIVGYQRNFLGAYQPNVTEYLPKALRHDLAKIGRLSPAPQAAGTYARHVLDRLLIDLSWNSSRLEGNTYSLLDTERLIEAGQLAEGKSAPEAQMILNHKQAIEYLVDGAQENEVDYFTICNLHGLLSDNLLADPAASGRVRVRGVAITGTTYHPLDVPQLVDECFRQVIAVARAIEDPFEQSFFLMVHIPYLQPFEDVNKRVSRLAANIPLIRHNLCPLSFIDVPAQTYVEGTLSIYENRRIELLKDVFVWAYQRSVERYSVVIGSLGQPDPFRMRHRGAIRAAVREVVLEALPPSASTIRLTERSKNGDIAAKDRSQFVAVCETEVHALHEGNIARYGLRPSEYRVWQAAWQRHIDERFLKPE